MVSIEELLQPISEVRPSGSDLRYDALMDSIRAARSEEDVTLPMGDWQHQAKRADHAVVASLASDGLRTRSKDLWLAVWLGEAYLQAERYDALVLVLKLLRCLQENFWPSLFPEIEEGDLSLRAAPLHWALSRYATMLQEFPVTAGGVSYAAYRSIRAGGNVAHGEEMLTPEKLDTSVAATADSFYSNSEEQLALALIELGKLHNFCEEQYGEDGPTFVNLRSKLEELHHAASQILRTRHYQASVPGSNIAEEPRSAQPLNLPPVTPHETVTSPEPKLPSVAVQSWEDALRQIETCVGFMAEQRPGNPAAYLMALALQHGRNEAQVGTPTSEARLTLKRLKDAGDATALLHHTILAMTEESGRYWLDLHRYAWYAAGAVNAASLQILVATLTRTLLEENDSIERQFFADDTPMANEETQRWLQDEIRPRVEKPSLLLMSVPLPEQSDTKTNDVSARAKRLVDGGSIGEAVRMLTEDASAARSGRARFLRRLEVTRLCLQTGHAGAAVHLVRQLLTEVDERKLDTWEDPDILGELLSLFLEALKGVEVDLHGERSSVYARLCQLNPAMALNRAMAGEEELWLVSGR